MQHSASNRTKCWPYVLQLEWWNGVSDERKCYIMQRNFNLLWKCIVRLVFSIEVFANSRSCQNLAAKEFRKSKQPANTHWPRFTTAEFLRAGLLNSAKSTAVWRWRQPRRCSANSRGARRRPQHTSLRKVKARKRDRTAAMLALLSPCRFCADSSSTLSFCEGAPREWD